MIKVKKVMVEGFGSFITPFSFIFKDKGLVIIKGENGVGKTTLINALCWAWFGETLKEKASVQTWEHEQPQNFQGTKVENIFEKDGKVYKVVRCIDYKGDVFGRRGKSGLFIKEGVKELHIGGKRETQMYLEKLLGMSYTLFKNSVTFGQKLNRFVEEDGKTKKLILEELFEVNFINTIKEKVDRDIKKYKEAFDEAEKQKIEVETQIKGKEETLKELEDYEKEDKKSKQSEIKELEEKKSKLVKEYSIASNDFSDLKGLDINIKITTLNKGLNTLNKTYQDSKRSFDRVIDSLESKPDTIAGLQESIKESEKAIEVINKSTCPECGQKLPLRERSLLIREKTEKVIKLKRLISETQTQNDKDAETLKDCKKDLSKLEEDYLKDSKDLLDKANIWEKKKEKYLKLELTKDNLEKEINQLRIRLEKLKSPVVTQKSIKIKEDLIKLKKQFKPIKITYNNLQIKLDNLKWVSTNPLSNSGIKAFIFDSQLNRINKKLKNYSKFIGFYPKIEVDMDSSRKDIIVTLYKGDIQIPFNDLSGGQGQLVNIIIAFAQNDIFSENKPMNILFLDEVFESLAQNSIDKITEIIVDKAQNLNVLLVTHLDTFNPFNSQSITLKLNGANTCLVSN